MKWLNFYKKNTLLKTFDYAWIVQNVFLLFSTMMRNNIYVFDFEVYQNDWFHFLTGKYSKLSTMIKKAIKTYYGELSSEYKYIDSYLYPEKYYEVYAKLLDVDVKDLKRIGELCDSWDMDKETLKIPVENLESLNKGV